MAAEVGSAPDRDVSDRRFAAQLLAGQPATGPLEVVERLLAVQGQDPRGARLAIRARTSGLSVADVDRALTLDRSLLITWLNRGTLHLIRSDDYWWLHRLTARPQFQVGCGRILARHGVTAAAADKGVDVAARALAVDGPLTRAQLAGRLSASGLPAEGGVVLHVLMLASLRGIAVRGPMIGAQHAYAHVRSWLGDPPPEPEPDRALGWLARRYLAGHGPAGERDLAKWAGLPLTWARRGLTVIAAELRDRPDGLAELGAAARPDGPPPRLLGAYDPVLMGWESRQPVLAGHQEIVTVNGLFRPFALVAGEAAGIWAYQGGQVALDLFSPLSPATQDALAAEARDVRRYLASEPEPTADEGS
ncbi:MAG: winged helix DNA-binding domain-containing protein [Streptosporangiaceae bacterium]